MQKKKWIGSTKIGRRLDKKIKSGKLKIEDIPLSSRNLVYINRLRKNPTRAEKIVGDFLYKNKINFKFQKGFFVPFHRIVDFYIPKQNLIIEIDGSSHYGKEEKDNRKDIWFINNRKVRIMRLTNEDIFNNYKWCLDSVIKDL